MSNTSKDAAASGYITTLLKRRCRFSKWELNEYNPGVLSPPMTKAEAESESIIKQAVALKKKYKYKLELKEKTEEEVEEEIINIRPRVRRAYTYKALNKLIQGSAADMTKKAMLDLYKEGIIPHIQVHDELDISVEKGSNQHEKIIEIMEEAVKLKIPNKADYESGDNWGEIKEQ